MHFYKLKVTMISIHPRIETRIPSMIRFLEIHYRRQETSSRPARTETTVIFLPDVWSVMPTRAEYIDTEAR